MRKEDIVALMNDIIEDIERENKKKDTTYLQEGIKKLKAENLELKRSITKLGKENKELKEDKKKLKFEEQDLDTMIKRLEDQAIHVFKVKEAEKSLPKLDVLEINDVNRYLQFALGDIICRVKITVNREK